MRGGVLRNESASVASVQPGEGGLRWRVVGLVIAILAGIGVAWLFVAFEVCNGELSDAGGVVEVCRHPTIADPPIVVLGLVALVGLAGVFTEISGFGFTLKRAVDQAKSSADAARVAAQMAATLVASTIFDPALTRARIDAHTGGTMEDVLSRITALHIQAADRIEFLRALGDKSVEEAASAWKEVLDRLLKVSTPEEVYAWHDRENETYSALVSAVKAYTSTARSLGLRRSSANDQGIVTE